MTGGTDQGTTFKNEKNSRDFNSGLLKSFFETLSPYSRFYAWHFNAGLTSGFTLVEVLVALALANICVMVALAVANVSNQSYRAQERVSDAQQGVRAALDLMVRDIRMAGYDPMALSNDPSPGIGILVATDSVLQFSADLNADRMDSGGIENLTYFYEPETKRLRQKEGQPYQIEGGLRKKKGGEPSAQTFIENVSSLKFTYLDAQGDPPSELGDIAAVVVTLCVQDHFKKGVAFERSLTTRVNCRNLRMRHRGSINSLSME
jgi:type IV pilus assembly protein PilW